MIISVTVGIHDLYLFLDMPYQLRASQISFVELMCRELESAYPEATVIVGPTENKFGVIVVDPANSDIVEDIQTLMEELSIQGDWEVPL